MKNVYDIETWNNSKVVEFYVNCFDRTMTIIFKDFKDFDILDITEMLNDSYYDWCEDSQDQCCEETMLDKLPENYKNNIVCVIYDKEEE